MNTVRQSAISIGLAVSMVMFVQGCTSENPTPANAPTTPQGTITAPAQVSASCNDRSWAAGSVDYCNGQVVYRDYVFDDYGADTGVLSPSPALLNLASRSGQNGNPIANTPSLLAPTAGDARYPKGAEATADLVKLVLQKSGDKLRATFELNALYSANQTIAALAIDTDNNPATGSQKLLGLTVKGADRVVQFNQGDPKTNLIVGETDFPTGSQFRVWAVTAQADGTVMNVAFRGTQEQAGATGAIPDQVLPGKGDWWEDRQAAALAAKDITAFSQVVDVNKMTQGVTELAPVVKGFHQRVYTSAYTVPGSTGEGMVMTGLPGREKATSVFCGQTFHFVGKYQPYGVYIPKQADLSKARSMQVILHGCEANHASQVNQPNMQKQFGDELDRILVAPLGRGSYGFYSDLSERDVLDVMDDITAKYAIDPDRVLIGGYSMGGYGSTRLAALYPDRFAGLSNWVGYTGNILNLPIPVNPLIDIEQMIQNATGRVFPVSANIGAVGNIINYLGNLRHVPSTHSYATLDELVQVSSGLAWAAKLGQADAVPYEFYLHAPAEHLTFMALDNWVKEAAYTKTLKRVKNPGRVTYKTNPAFAFPEYGIAHDKAYWISQIQARQVGDVQLDLHSTACENLSVSTSSGQSAGNGPVPYVQTFRRVTQVMALTPINAIKGTVTNLKSALIDVQGSCLKPGAAYEIQSDGSSTLVFNNGRQLTLMPGLNKGNL